MKKQTDQNGLLINKISDNDIRIEVRKKDQKTLESLVEYLTSIQYKFIKNILLQLQRNDSPKMIHIRKGFAPMYCVEDLNPMES